MKICSVAVAAPLSQFLSASMSSLLYILSLASLALILRWSSRVILSTGVCHTASQLTWTPPDPPQVLRVTSVDDDDGATCCYNALEIVTYGLWLRKADVEYRDANLQDSSSSCCLVCLEDIKDADEVRELPCDHVFHRDCLDRWAARGRPTCPLCREPLQAAAATAKTKSSGEYEPLELALLGCVSAVQGGRWTMME